MSELNRLIWLDLEMTGLNPNEDRILEIATIVTDAQLNIVAEGPVYAIHQTDEILEKMDKWCQKHHAQSGLITRVQNSHINEKEAEIKTLEFLKQHVGAQHSPLCGNSICQDRRFLFHYMPDLEKFFHYRHLDVSSIKILTQIWYPGIAHSLKKESTHVALQDIKDSIEELRFYRQHIFNKI